MASTKRPFRAATWSIIRPIPYAGNGRGSKHVALFQPPRCWISDDIASRIPKRPRSLESREAFSFFSGRNRLSDKRRGLNEKYDYIRSKYYSLLTEFFEIFLEILGNSSLDYNFCKHLSHFPRALIFYEAKNRRHGDPRTSATRV